MSVTDRGTFQFYSTVMIEVLWMYIIPPVWHIVLHAWIHAVQLMILFL